NIPMTTEEPMPENVTVHIHVPAHGRTAAQQRDVTIPMRDSLNMASQFIQDRLHEKANVFVHCAHGEDRTGTVVGRIRDCAAWKGEFDRYGGTFYKPLKKLFTSSQAPSLDFNRALVQLDPHPCGGN
ncbi:MAG: dual specificity protein phosphatase family protein, partial [Deltaproteobacteria bacterium]|nr:dual specificity protein phosphatase family protein [Deltaproteobacteria bacterium]